MCYCSRVNHSLRDWAWLRSLGSHHMGRLLSSSRITVMCFREQVHHTQRPPCFSCRCLLVWRPKASTLTVGPTAPAQPQSGSLVQLLGTGGPKHQHSTWKNHAEEASNPKGAPEKSMSAGNSSLSKPCSNVLYSKVINVSLMQDTNEKICQKQNSEGRRPFPLVLGTRPSKVNVWGRSSMDWMGLGRKWVKAAWVLRAINTGQLC